MALRRPDNRVIAPRRPQRGLDEAEFREILAEAAREERPIRFTKRELLEAARELGIPQAQVERAYRARFGRAAPPAGAPPALHPAPWISPPRGASVSRGEGSLVLRLAPRRLLLPLLPAPGALSLALALAQPGPDDWLQVLALLLDGTHSAWVLAALLLSGALARAALETVELEVWPDRAELRRRIGGWVLSVERLSGPLVARRSLEDPRVVELRDECSVTPLRRSRAEARWICEVLADRPG